MGRKNGAAVISGYDDYSSVDDGHWHFIAGKAIRNSNTMQLYQDGIKICELTTDGLEDLVMSSEVSLKIGVGRQFIYYFDGDLDDIRIYNRTLNDAEILALYNENHVSVNTPDLSEVINSSFEIPINARNIKDGDNAISYQFDLIYDPQKIQYKNYCIEGMLSENGLVQINPAINKLSVAWAGDTPISGSGSLLSIQFKALKAGYTIPVISNFLLNTDTIRNLENGVIIIHDNYGDVDNNDNIQAFDAALSLQCSVGMDPLPFIDPLPWEDWRIDLANVDGLGNITAYDASLILQYVAGLINTFPVEVHEKNFTAPLADVNISLEDGFLVFRSAGELYGLNVYVNDNWDMLGIPQFIKTEALTANHVSETDYAAGMAFTQPPIVNEILLKIPIRMEDKSSITFNLIINNETKQVTLETETGIFNLKTEPFAVYPNPAGSALYIDNTGENAHVVVYDMQGNLQISAKIKDNRIDISTLRTGLYIIHIWGNNRMVTKKLIKE
jgi:hypothetical protein